MGGRLNTNVEEDILVSDAQSPEHLNTNVMAPPQVGSVSPPADGLTRQDWLIGEDQAASEFVLDGYGATLDNSLTFSDQSPMSLVVTYFNHFFSQLPPQRMLYDLNSLRLLDMTLTVRLGNPELKSLTYPSVYDCHSRENLCQLLPCSLLLLKRLRLYTTPEGCSLGVRHDEIINLSADGEPVLKLQYMQICKPAGSQSGTEALPDGEMIQVDSLQHEEIVECDATNNGGNVGGEGPSLTAIAFPKKNKRKMSERKCTTDKSIGLVDLQQCSGMKREDAANSLGVSISTFKRRCRDNGIPRWSSRKINKEKQSLSTSTRKGATKSVLGAEGSHNPTSLCPKLLPGAVGTVSWPSSLNGSHRGYIQGSKPPELRGKNNESFSYMTPENGGILIENAESSKNVSNFFPSAAEADLEGWISESVRTDLPFSDPASKQSMATLSRPMPHVGAKQDTRIVTFKAEWKMPHGKDKIIRFKMSSTSGIDKLKEEVTKRLMLEASTFSIEYRDDEGEWISLTCDADLQELQDSMNISSSSGKNIIRLRVQDEIDNSSKLV